MTPSFATSLDALSGWRITLAKRLDDVAGFLREHELIDAHAAARLVSLRERLGHEKLVVAFVAEFSRGKSELINAIFFADTGRRVLPATPGRTTMCPVELAWDALHPATLMMLPIETRRDGLSLAELRTQRRAWTTLPLHVHEPEQLAQSLQEVTRTHWVTQGRARELGFWHDEQPDDNPPVNEAGLVEVPVWRHALINYPHPLLRQGLVVLDTPGLNAIGAEPELTLSLLPAAHATIFILGADTGVTRSDLNVWRDHLSTQGQTRFVVLNKIDALLDPLATRAAVDAQIDSQCADTARTLGIPAERVFPLSAREALAARSAGDDAALRRSRLPALEAALGSQLLPQRRQVLERVVLDGAQQIEAHVSRRLGDQRRQLADQGLELRGLRGKSGARIALMLKRVDIETHEFEQCTVRLHAMRGVHSRMLKDVLAELSADKLRDDVAQMQAEMKATLLNLGAKKAFVAMCARLRGALATTQQRSEEIREMLTASFTRLNAEFGFSLALTRSPELARFTEELDLIGHNYVKYLGLTQALRLSQPKFMEQFRRMLVSKLRVVFENASSEIELWNKATSAQVDAQLRERRRSFRRRRESLERIQTAGGELEQRLTEIEAQDARVQALEAHVHALLEALREQACAGPQAGPGAAPSAVSAAVSAAAPRTAHADGAPPALRLARA